ncbi:MAG: hypothetical protein JNK49_02585 [Planctomycetes bacterium]|nr:hypothetical protein [Planctomycetota bacterium]
MRIPLCSRLAALLLLPTLSTTTQAQGKVLPPGMDHVEGPLVYTYPFGRQTGAIQLLYNADQLTTQAGLIFGMRFRQSQVTASQTYPAYTKNYQVTAYTVATNAAAMTAAPAPNIGSATGTVVFSGPLTLPAVNFTTTYPAPFGIHVPFSAPYPYDGSQGNLLLLIETTDTVAVPTGSYRLDAVNFRNNVVTGLATNLDNAGCSAQGAALSLATSSTAAIVGGSIDQNFSSTLNGAFPLVLSCLSFEKQPSDLAVYGMPGCTSWLGSFVSRLVLENQGGGYPLLSWTLPNAPWIEGMALIGQAVGVAANNTLADTVTSNGMATRIGSSSFPVVRMDMSFSGNLTTWSKGANGTTIVVVEFDGIFP